MGSAKDKHGVRERFAKERLVFAKNGRLQMKEFRSTAMWSVDDNYIIFYFLWFIDIINPNWIIPGNLAKQKDLALELSQLQAWIMHGCNIWICLFIIRVHIHIPSIHIHIYIYIYICIYAYKPDVCLYIHIMVFIHMCAMREQYTIYFLPNEGPPPVTTWLTTDETGAFSH